MNLLNPKDFDNDQRREFVNTQQRFAVYRDVEARVRDVRGSMVWATSRGSEYLARSAYDKAGIRRQKSLGPRSEQTEKLKRDFETGRDEVQRRFKDITAALNRQAAINRALGLGRVPLLSARILRALDRAGSLGVGLRVVGTHAIFAYEAAAGVMVDLSLVTTGDVDLLMDSRSNLRFVLSDEVAERSLLQLLRSVDRSFERTAQAYRAQNAEGYLVDLIKPMRNPPWSADVNRVSDTDTEDLTASEIEGLTWLESAPPFEATAIDEKGQPLRIVAVDPRVWAAHKFWVSRRIDRDPIKKRRDEAQAITIAAIVRDLLPHLPYESEALRMLPREVFDAAAPLFR